MSNLDELFERLDRTEEQNAWMVQALKQLLAIEAGVEHEPADPLDAWLAEAPLDDLPVETDDNEHIAVPSRPRPKKPPCPHNRQGIDDDGNVICQRCGTVLTSSGVVQRMVGANGNIIPVPGESVPRWATEQSPGASSKNPGGKLVPFSG